MARDLDDELLESVKVRRRRLREAFIYGGLRTRRTVSDINRRLMFSIIAAAVACAACAGTSFVKAHIHDSATASTTSSTSSSTPSSSAVESGSTDAPLTTFQPLATATAAPKNTPTPTKSPSASPSATSSSTRTP